MMYQVYKMVDGDTLESVASMVNCTGDELVRLNGIDESGFISESYIVVPKSDNMYSTYVVKNGDTLYSVSNRFNVDLDVLYAINGLDDGDFIYPNQEILVPNQGISIYFTKEGDTLSDVSDYFNVNVSDILESNPNLYLMSDQLVIYKRD